MFSKGLSQVDFAIAGGIFILMFAFLVLFNTNYFSTMKNDATMTEKRSFTLSLMNDLMGEGEPSEWQNIVQTFGNNSAANWSRSLSRSTNATVEYFSSGQLEEAGDGNYSVINETSGADTLEATFPFLGIPGNASIGSLNFRVLYNTSEFNAEYGEGDYMDDIYFFDQGSEEYHEDWGAGTTGNEFIWWNSSDAVYRISGVNATNTMTIRLYYNPEGFGTCYFDALNISANYSYYPFYPSKLGLVSDSCSFEILVNNTVDDLPNEKIEANLSYLGYDEIDENSVMVYNESGQAIACNISNGIIAFSANIANNTEQWYRVWFSGNSSSNISSPACSSEISGTDNLTVANMNETIFPYRRIPVIQYRKIAVLQTTDYEIMKGVTDVKYDFHITIKNSTGGVFLEYGGDVPRKGDVNAIQRSVLYQNSSAGIEEGSIIVYVW